MTLFSQASSSDLRHVRPILQVGRHALRLSLGSVLFLGWTLAGKALEPLSSGQRLIQRITDPEM